jgi:hypothetical protein
VTLERGDGRPRLDAAPVDRQAYTVGLLDINSREHLPETSDCSFRKEAADH